MRWRRAWVLGGCAMGVAGLSWFPIQLAAQAPVDADVAGSWRASPLRVRIEVLSWGPDCGPRPPANSSEPGGGVQIATRGDVLVLSGAVEGRSDACWSANRALRRISTTHTPGTWKAVCRTLRDDPRQESGVYRFVREGADLLRFSERSEYDWQLKSSRCRAVRVARRTFSRVTGANGSHGGVRSSRVTAPARRCTPGDAAALRFAPGETTLQPGEAWCPRLLRVDAHGCPLSGRVRSPLRIVPEGLAQVDEDGCIRPLPSAEGKTLTIEARDGAWTARATVHVRALGLTDLIAGGGAEDAPRGALDSPGGEEGARAVAVAEGEARTPPSITPSWGLWVFLLLGIASSLGAAAWWWMRRGGRSSVERQRGGDGSADVLEPGGGEHDTAPSSVLPPRDSGVVETRVCPVCRRSLPFDALRCPHDGEATVTYEEYVARQREAARQGSRVCPRCGGRYGAEERFCGKDGTPLL